MPANAAPTTTPTAATVSFEVAARTLDQAAHILLVTEDGDIAVTSKGWQDEAEETDAGGDAYWVGTAAGVTLTMRAAENPTVAVVATAAWDALRFRDGDRVITALPLQGMALARHPQAAVTPEQAERQEHPAQFVSPSDRFVVMLQVGTVKGLPAYEPLAYGLAGQPSPEQLLRRGSRATAFTTELAACCALRESVTAWQRDGLTFHRDKMVRILKVEAAP